jgi:hypothetical protein
MELFGGKLRQLGVSSVEVVSILILVIGVSVVLWKYVPSSWLNINAAEFQKGAQKPLAEQYKQCRDDFTQKTAGSPANFDTLQSQNVDFVRICMERAGFKINEALLASKLENQAKIVSDTYRDWIEQSRKDAPTSGFSALEYKKSAADLQLAITQEKIRVSCYLDVSLWCWQK